MPESPIEVRITADTREIAQHYADPAAPARLAALQAELERIIAATDELVAESEPLGASDPSIDLATEGFRELANALRRVLAISRGEATR